AKERKAGERGQGQRRTVASVAGDRLLQEPERLGDPPGRRQEHFVGAEIEIVSREIRAWAPGGARGLRGLQLRLDDAGHARRDLVLKLEHVLEQPLEAVGPEMRTRTGIDQLPGDADAVA